MYFFQFILKTLVILNNCVINTLTIQLNVINSMGCADKGLATYVATCLSFLATF